MLNLFHLELYLGGSLVMAFFLHLFQITNKSVKLSDTTILIWSLLWFITAPIFTSAFILGIIYGVISSIVNMFKK
jgi:hypothetical protein